MKRSLLALATALVLTTALTACGSDRGDSPNDANGSVTNGSAAPGQVSRRYDRPGDYLRDYMDDGRYAAAPGGRVYGGRRSSSRDMTQDARNIVRDTGSGLKELGRDIRDGIQDLGRDARQAARDMDSSGTPSWEPDSSAQR